MKILFLCKASVAEGLGHLIRSLTLANYISQNHKSIHISFVLISDLPLSHKLANTPFVTQILSNFDEFSDDSFYDITILDMLSLKEDHIHRVKSRTKKTVSISPIFNRMPLCDLLITRTVHNSYKEVKIDIAAGLQYNIIRADCTPIPSEKYQAILNQHELHVAISMGGTDPENRTLEVIRNLKNVESEAVFWVMIGEGYTHKLNDLIQEINQDSQHEIIICKTNKSMWKVLSNCQFAILSGGITSYESAYARLPAMNYFHNRDRAYLVKELEYNNLCLPICYNLEEIPSLIKELLKDKSKLLQIHNNCKRTFKTNSLQNVCSAIGI